MREVKESANYVRVTHFPRLNPAASKAGRLLLRARPDRSKLGGAGLRFRHLLLCAIPGLALATLFLPKGMIERHHQRANDIIEGSPLDGRDHDGCRHTGVELDIRQRGELLLVNPDKGHVIGIVGLGVDKAVGRNLDNVAMDNRDNALLVCSKVNFSAHIGANIADVLDRDLGLDGEGILIRHDIKYLFAALNDATDRKYA